MNKQELLDFEFESSDIGQTTIRNYLYLLLRTLWNEGEGFSGKRPFGNSGWEFDLYKAVVKAGAVKGKLDEDGYVEEVDTKAANNLIRDLISYMCFGEPKMMNAPMEEVLADLDCPISDEDRVPWAAEVRELRKKVAWMLEYWDIEDISRSENDASFETDYASVYFQFNQSDLDENKDLSKERALELAMIYSPLGK